MRDRDIWRQNIDKTWEVKDCITNHINDAKVEKNRLPLVNKNNQTFGENNQGYYFVKGKNKYFNINDELISHENDDEFIIL